MIVSRQSTEADYYDIAAPTLVLTWLEQLLCEINCFDYVVLLLSSDNLSATYLKENPIFDSCTKHMELNSHFIRDRVLDKAVNILTKALSKAHFQTLRSKLVVVPHPAQLEGESKG